MKAVRLAFAAAAWLLVAVVCLQVVLAGAALLVGPKLLATHVMIGHFVTIPIVLMLILSLVGRLPYRFALLSIGLYMLYGLQYFFTNWPPAHLVALRAGHAANALVLLAVASFTARSAWAHIRGEAGGAEGKADSPTS